MSMHSIECATPKKATTKKEEDVNQSKTANMPKLAARRRAAEKFPVPPPKLGALKPDPKKVGIPLALQTQNRKPLTPEQQAAADAKLKAAATPKSNVLPLTGRDALKAIAGGASLDGASGSYPYRRDPETGLTSAQPATAKPKATKTAPKKEAPTKPVKKVGVGATARAAILAGKTNAEALAAVMKAHPDCNSNAGCMSWYRGKLRDEGLLKSDGTISAKGEASLAK